ncbi:MAG: phosphoenolpyruvate carboxykinase [Nitrospinota bacterium]|nr:phosphoenolpyruvate carboxykinase [Nitrospinota bacterium]
MPSRRKPYYITDRKVIVDYSSVFCDTTAGLLNSELFTEVVRRFVRRVVRRQDTVYELLTLGFPGKNQKQMTTGLVNIFRLLATHSAKEISTMAPEYQRMLNDQVRFIELKDLLYNFWLKLERIAYMEVPKRDTEINDDLHYAQFVKANEDLKNVILQTQRRISDNLEGNLRSFRQMPAFANLSMLVRKIDWDCPKKLSFLKQIPFVRNTLIFPPLILYPASNTRKGSFGPIDKVTPGMLNIHASEWFCFPAKVGDLLAFVYFHRDFSSLALSMANLFEMAGKNDLKKKRPDMIVMFGVDPNALPGDTGYHFMKDADVYLGLVAHKEELEYFGYFKKIALTLHNLEMMKRGHLPVHGAMVSMELKDGGTANVALIGDSGAGKSETLEALRILADEHIRDMKIIFDDMGSLRIDKDGSVLGFGTETGAFVRLDDLTPGYAYEQIERSVFMNPHMNARLVLPVSKYKHITKGYPVDILMYANNYESVETESKALDFFDDMDKALAVFSDGARQAKGTTDETGLVHTYFANPFGAIQEKEKHEKIAVKTFKALFGKGVKVGQIRTRLGVPGFEQEGPKAASLELFDVIRAGKK